MFARFHLAVTEQFARYLPVLPLGLALIFAPVLILRSDGLPRMLALQSELGRVKEENRVMGREVSRLSAEVRDLRDDPRAVERIARENLGFVRKNEVVFQFGRSR